MVRLHPGGGWARDNDYAEDDMYIHMDVVYIYIIIILLRGISGNMASYSLAGNFMNERRPWISPENTYPTSVCMKICDVGLILMLSTLLQLYKCTVAHNMLY